MSKQTTAGTVLIVDDNADMRELLATKLEMSGYKTHTSASVDDARRKVGAIQFDAVITDIRMPGDDGISLCKSITASVSDLPVIVMTAFGSVEAATDALRAGAYDFITKPIEMELLEHSVGRAVGYSQLHRRVHELEVNEPAAGFGELIGDSPAMQNLYRELASVSQMDTTVLLHGESGTGKELVARSLHAKGPRAAGPFIAINCAAFSETLLESELFGHTTGAFTDAGAARRGLFQQASGGTLMLDEVGDMPPSMQVKLLRTLEESKIRPVGSDQEVEVDVRIIAASHKDLESEVEEGNFREDLLYRINVFGVRLPPLRERGHDVLQIASVFLANFASKAGKDVVRFDEAFAEKLLNYSWPGNIRELRNVMERAVVLAREDTLRLRDLPAKIANFERSSLVIGDDDPRELVSLAEVERRYINHVLEAVNHNQTQAAKILGVDRKTLYRRRQQPSTPK